MIHQEIPTFQPSNIVNFWYIAFYKEHSPTGHWTCAHNVYKGPRLRKSVPEVEVASVCALTGFACRFALSCLPFQPAAAGFRSLQDLPFFSLTDVKGSKKATSAQPRRNPAGKKQDKTERASRKEEETSPTKRRNSRNSRSKAEQSGSLGT